MSEMFLLPDGKGREPFLLVKAVLDALTTLDRTDGPIGRTIIQSLPALCRQNRESAAHDIRKGMILGQVRETTAIFDWQEAINNTCRSPQRAVSLIRLYNGEQYGHVVAERLRRVGLAKEDGTISAQILNIIDCCLACDDAGKVRVKSLQKRSAPAVEAAVAAAG